jgi:hypothetical protein
MPSLFTMDGLAQVVSVSTSRQSRIVGQALIFPGIECCLQQQPKQQHDRGAGPNDSRRGPVEVKRELAARLCKLYAEVKETQLWRANVGIAELGEHNLYHLGQDGLEPITMVMVEFRRGRSAEKRLALG